MSKKLSDTMLQTIAVIADAGGDVGLRRWWGSNNPDIIPNSLRDVRDNSFMALESRGAAVITWGEKPSGYRSTRPMLRIRLTIKGWCALKTRYQQGNQDVQRIQRQIAARLLMAQWMDEGGLTVEDIGPKGIIRQAFGISQSWKIDLSSHYREAAHYSVRLTIKNLQVEAGKVGFVSNRYDQGRGTWLESGYGSIPRNTPEQARELANYLLEAARLSEELAIHADEQGFINLEDFAL